MNHRPARYRPVSLYHQRGVNLIEIMVAMVIGLFLVVGASTLYVNTKKTSDVDDAIARMQETARYAMSIIESDVRMANYWGLKKDGSSFTNANSLNTTVTGTTTSNKFGGMTAASLEPTTGNTCGNGYATKVEAYLEATNNDYPFTATCPASPTSASASADTLTVRRASTPTSSADGQYLQICSTRTTATLINDATATCSNGEIHNLSVNLYYVDRGSDQNTKYPSLRRKTLGSGKTFSDVEVIPGVEDIQIELGWDDSSDVMNSIGAVRYVQPGNTVLSSGRIVAVRIWLLIRAEQPDYSFKETRTYSYADRMTNTVSDLNAGGADGAMYAPRDNYRRLLVSRTIYIRNVTGT